MQAAETAKEKREAAKAMLGHVCRLWLAALAVCQAARIHLAQRKAPRVSDQLCGDVPCIQACQVRARQEALRKALGDEPAEAASRADTLETSLLPGPDGSEPCSDQELLQQQLPDAEVRRRGPDPCRKLFGTMRACTACAKRTYLRHLSCQALKKLSPCEALAEAVVSLLPWLVFASAISGQCYPCKDTDFASLTHSTAHQSPP